MRFPGPTARGVAGTNDIAKRAALLAEFINMKNKNGAALAICAAAFTRFAGTNRSSHP